MDYDTSKKIFNYANTAALYEVIDIAVGVSHPTNALGEPLPINEANGNWRLFMIAYLNCIEYLTIHRDYKPGDIDELVKELCLLYNSLCCYSVQWWTMQIWQRDKMLDSIFYTVV